MSLCLFHVPRVVDVKLMRHKQDGGGGVKPKLVLDEEGTTLGILYDDERGTKSCTSESSSVNSGYKKLISRAP